MYTSRITHLIALVLICLTYLLAFETPRPAAQVEQRHPLDPLTEAEINAAVGVLSAAPGFPDNALFATIVLKEPAKSEVLSYAPGRAIARQAFAVILDRRQNRTIEAVVDLETTRVASWNEVKGVQPVVLEAEHEVLVRVVKSDARWLESMRKRGINNPDDVQIDYWAVGQVAPQYQSRRLLRAVSYFKGNSTNFYGRPIEGVGVLVDMNAERVVEFVDTGALPLPPASQELDEKSTGVREAPKALTIAQPDGASFTVSGQEIRWQKWRFRYTMHPREGLVLHTVGYEDEGRVRPIMYRASISEMAVPYGDPDRNWRWRSAFDVGEYGMGRLASPIEANTDAPSNARLIDVTFAGDNGRAYVLPRAVGIYERDGGMLWKHYESYSKTNESRRARELVIFFIATIGNYDYAINWIFHQDGVLELDAALTGIMLPKGVREQKATGHGASEKSAHLVSANVVAPHHQHFFNFRLDFDVDGPVNSICEMNTRALPAGPANPSLNGMIMEETNTSNRGRSAASDAHGIGADVGHQESGRAERARPSHQLHPGARCEFNSVHRRDVAGAAACRLHQSSLLGDTLPRRRDVCRRLVSQPEPRRRRASQVGRQQRAAVQAGRCRLVHDGHHAHPAAGGMAGDAGHPRRVQDDPRRVLLAQSRPRRAEIGGVRS